MPVKAEEEEDEVLQSTRGNVLFPFRPSLAVSVARASSKVKSPAKEEMVKLQVGYEDESVAEYRKRKRRMRNVVRPTDAGERAGSEREKGAAAAAWTGGWQRRQAQVPTDSGRARRNCVSFFFFCSSFFSRSSPLNLML